MDTPEQFKFAPNLYSELHNTAFNWRQVGHFPLMEELVLRSGASYRNINEPPSEMDTIKECYANAAHIALNLPREHDETKGYTYVEGFVLTPKLIMPIQHAWCLRPDRTVHDTTLRNQIDAEYIGIEIDAKTLRHELLTNKVYGLLDIGVYNLNLIKKINPGLIQEWEQFAKERKLGILSNQ